ncbi:hypothetical protein LPA06_11430 [Lacticaseibacillus paracasei subsp. tolerans]|nr:hypothetical protein LPA06_11430 [Lacticaseibacillus paracasei subsp. tolerans]
MIRLLKSQHQSNTRLINNPDVNNAVKDFYKPQLAAIFMPSSPSVIDSKSSGKLRRKPDPSKKLWKEF